MNQNWANLVWRSPLATRVRSEFARYVPGQRHPTKCCVVRPKHGQRRCFVATRTGSGPWAGENGPNRPPSTRLAEPAQKRVWLANAEGDYREQPRPSIRLREPSRDKTNSELVIRWQSPLTVLSASNAQGRMTAARRRWRLPVDEAQCKVHRSAVVGNRDPCHQNCPHTPNE